MFVKTECPYCKKNAYASLSLHCLETTLYSDMDSATRYAVEYVEIEETIKEEEFIKDVLCTMREHVNNGVEIKELCRILKTIFPVAAAYCCDVIQKLKEVMGMYSPDMRHLYFVTP